MHYSTKIIELGSCAFRQPKAKSHCRFIHGYRLTAKFWFAANELDENNWVVDFGSLKELKNLLQKQFDHTTCISKHDPHLDEFIELEKSGVCDLRIMDGVGIEKFAEWCHDAADNFAGVLTKMRCRCVRVEVFEHENNSAIYEAIPKEMNSSINDSYLDTRLQQLYGDDNTVDLNTKDEKIKDYAGNDLPVEDVDKGENPRTGQRKTTGKWVDPKFKGKTTNTWLF